MTEILSLSPIWNVYKNKGTMLTTTKYEIALELHSKKMSHFLNCQFRYYYY